ncbi:MAG: protein kinase [Acidobacteria bacterium]|nr:protein kinase [Acidobacteriota bacterium]
MSEDHLKQAKKALRERDFQRAGDYYYLAGRYDEALELYTKVQNWELCAKVCEETKNYREALKYVEMMGNYEKAADLAFQIGDSRKAIEFYEKSGNLYKAAQISEKSHDYQKAGEIYAKSGDYIKATTAFINSGEYDRALEFIKILINKRKQEIDSKNISDKTDNVIRSYKAKAAELLQKVNRLSEAAEYYSEIDDKQKAASLYSLNNQPDKAFHLYLEGGYAREALNEFHKYPSQVNADAKILADLNYNAGNYQQAAVFFEKAGKNIDAAESYEKAGSIARAAELYAENKQPMKAVELYKKDEQYFEAAQVLLNSGRSKEAASLAEEHGLYNMAAELYEKTNKLEKSSVLYEKAGNVQNAAKLYYKLNNIEKALELFRNHRERFDEPILVRDLLILEGQYIDAANISMQIEDFEKAAELLKKAKKFSESAELYSALKNYIEAGEMYIQANEIEKAAWHFEKAKSYHRAGDCYLNLLRYQKAAECYLTAHEFMKAAQVYYNLKDLDRTINVLQKIKKDDPQYYEACFKLGKIFHTQKFYNLAKIKLQDSIGGKPVNRETIEAYYLLAECHFNTGEYRTAADKYDQILSFDFNYRDALRFREQALSFREENKKVEKKIDETIEFVDLLQLKEGDVIAKRFKIEGELGSGGMGKVYKAYDNELDERVAVKILLTQFGDYEEERMHLVNEIKIARRISHPFVIKVFDIGDWLGNKFFTMQYVEGIDLVGWFNNNLDKNFKVKMVLIRKICEGLKAAHDLGVIHRDIKPKNIMVNSHNDPIILDFGIAEAMNAYLKSASNQLVGSPNYMSPEQISDSGYDHRTDIYSLGCVMYEMFTGRKPYVVNDLTELFMVKLDRTPRLPTEFNPSIPVELEQIIMKSLMRNPDERYKDMSELISDINLFVATKGV